MDQMTLLLQPGASGNFNNSSSFSVVKGKKSMHLPVLVFVCNKKAHHLSCSFEREDQIQLFILAFCPNSYSKLNNTHFLSTICFLHSSSAGSGISQNTELKAKLEERGWKTTQSFIIL